MSDAAIFLSPGGPFPAGRLASMLGHTAWAMGASTVSCPGRALHRWSRAILRPLGVAVQLTGRPDLQAPLWVANHLSWLDPLVLLSLRPMTALAKGEVAKYPFIGRASRRLGLAFVDRTDAVSRAMAVAGLARGLRAGAPQLLFPEGTTTSGHALAPLQEGGLRAAFRCGSRVQAFRLSSPDPGYPWLGDDELLPHVIRLLRTRETPVRLEAREPLDPRHFRSEATWIEAIRQQLLPTP